MPEDAYVDALLADLEFALPSIWGRKVVSSSSAAARRASFPRRRSTACWPAFARACRCCPTPRSRWKPIPGTFERQKFAGFFARRRQPAVAGRPELRPRAAAGAGPRARRRRSAPRRGGGADDLRQREPRPHVRLAATRRWRSARADLAAALAFAPPHLSFYHLTLEPNTLFHRYPPPLPDDDTAADIEDAVHATLAARRLPALRDVGATRSRGRAVRAQRQLLALRRLSRHRRRRALQAVVRRPHRAAVALEAAEAIPGTASRRAGRCRKRSR